MKFVTTTESLTLQGEDEKSL